MEIGFLTADGVYSQATFPDGTVIVPPRPDAEHEWNGKKWVKAKEPAKEPTSLAAPAPDQITQG